MSQLTITKAGPAESGTPADRISVSVSSTWVWTRSNRGYPRSSTTISDTGLPLTSINERFSYGVKSYIGFRSPLRKPDSKSRCSTLSSRTVRSRSTATSLPGSSSSAFLKARFGLVKPFEYMERDSEPSLPSVATEPRRYPYRHPHVNLLSLPPGFNQVVTERTHPPSVLTVFLLATRCHPLLDDSRALLVGLLDNASKTVETVGERTAGFQPTGFETGVNEKGSLPTQGSDPAISR